VDIHGQHEHQGLLRPREQREILDRYGGAEEPAREVRSLHAHLVGLESELKEKQARIRELEARADFLSFQSKEIEEAGLAPDEEDLLEEEANRLEHALELAQGARSLHEGLYGGDNALADRLSDLRALLGRLGRMDPSLKGWEGTLDEAYHLVRDLGQRLGSYAEGIEHDPARLETIRERQDLIFRLKRKYGATLGDVLATGSRLKKELEELDGAAFDLKELEEEVERARRHFLHKVSELTALRVEAARQLQEEVMEVFPEVGLERGECRVDLQPLEEPGPGGGERVEFLVSLNPGFPAGPLSRIASGGELSRVMLALKAILAGVDRVPTLVFDEIDAGIGGEIALMVAEKLRGVARHHQVFVITHLPQLASRAHHQLSVEKGEVEGLAATRVRELRGEERVREVARMLGGDPESATSRDHARELLEAS
jgi:DNA repair protein RecN (Recombination protein N)